MMTATTAAPASPDNAPRLRASGTAAGVLTSRPVAWGLVAALLAVFFALGVASVLSKSNTFDETVHVAAGLHYWQLNDYRVDPENGNLPQRWMALPLLPAGLELPRFEDEPNPDQWVYANALFYRSQNKPEAILLTSRVMILLLAVGLGVLVYALSARLFGRGGGLISTVLYCFSTTILAHGRLATSDLTAALCFLASVNCLWSMLRRFTPLTVLASALMMGLTFVAKMSGVLIVPMGILLIVIRLIHPEALPVACGRFRRQVAGRVRQLGLFVGAIVVHAAVVVLVIWAFYGFRYSAISPHLPGREAMDARWQKVLAKPFPMQRALVYARDHRLLPEAYLVGQAHVLKYSQVRLAFLNGRYSIHGWWWFFPYCFLIKTPLSLFVVLILAIVAAILAWRRNATAGAKWVRSGLWKGFYRTAPLWVLLGVYWATAIVSKINIGHRHILPTYPVLFILAGSVIALFRRGSLLGWVVVLALVLYAAEGISTFPNYLAYFNQIGGGPKNGYHHLVDSSLDWGQDLPGLKRWLDREGLSDPSSPTPVYLSYFGAGNPTHHGIRAIRLPGFIDLDMPYPPPIPLMLTGGVYCISATMLQTVPKGPPGPWTYGQEAAYQMALTNVMQLLQTGPDNVQAVVRGPDGPKWSQELLRFHQLRSKRLAVYLRHLREPDDQVGYSILIYRLTDEDVATILLGPPVDIQDEDRSLFEEP